MPRNTGVIPARSREWFQARIGKRIFRVRSGESRCRCKPCIGAVTNGLIVGDTKDASITDLHIYVLMDGGQAELGMRYADKPVRKRR